MLYNFYLRWRLFFLFSYIQKQIRTSERAILIPGVNANYFSERFLHNFARVLSDATGLFTVAIAHRDNNGLFQVRWLVIGHNAAIAWHHSNRVARAFIDVRAPRIDNIEQFLEGYEETRLQFVEQTGVQLEPFNILGGVYAFDKEND